MLEDNIDIVESKGEYKDFPYKYSLYLYCKKVWEDDFHEKQTDAHIIEEFCKALTYAIEIKGGNNYEL